MTLEQIQTSDWAAPATDEQIERAAENLRARGFEVTVPTDCTASEQEGWRTAALDHMQRVLKAELIRSEACSW